MGVQEAPQRPSNYEIMRDRMEVEFVKGTSKNSILGEYGFRILSKQAKILLISHKFVLPDNFKGMVKSASSNSNLFTKQAVFFAGKGEALKKASLKLGGRPDITGDVSSTILLFDFSPVVIQFWDADEEFEAVLKFMWDKNAVDFMPFETIAFATAHLIARLKKNYRRYSNGKNNCCRRERRRR